MRQTAEKRHYLRLQSVLAIAEGMPATQVSQLTGRNLKSIYNYIQAYLSTCQVSSLSDASRSGRPPVASSITDSRISMALQTHPMQSGYHTTTRTVVMPRDHSSRKYNCVISADTLRRPMKAMDHLWRSVKERNSANYQYDNVQTHAMAALDYIRALTNKQARIKAGILSDKFWLKAFL